MPEIFPLERESSPKRRMKASFSHGGGEKNGIIPDLRRGKKAEELP
jgi:hypothetical protein